MGISKNGNPIVSLVSNETSLSYSVTHNIMNLYLTVLV